MNVVNFLTLCNASVINAVTQSEIFQVEFRMQADGRLGNRTLPAGLPRTLATISRFRRSIVASVLPELANTPAEVQRLKILNTMALPIQTLEIANDIIQKWKTEGWSSLTEAEKELFRKAYNDSETRILSMPYLPNIHSQLLELMRYGWSAIPTKRVTPAEAISAVLTGIAMNLDRVELTLQTWLPERTLFFGGVMLASELNAPSEPNE